MQFVKNGPDIPEHLLQAHEDGRVVFFCGAGISYPARLPGFYGLVESLYSEVGDVPSQIERTAIDSGQYDTAIGLLEGRLRGGREQVRQHLPKILNPDLTARRATATHKALLTLGRTRDDRYRLITTNFDRLFEIVKKREKLKFKQYEAPLLPVPKKRWDGLVYLHGLLPDAPTTNDLDQLVLSSGDFGLAYLTERWAARFASDLFRNYTVCFIGYSINDPVLRYMLDALAADRLLGESSPPMYAFGSYGRGKESERANEWRAKNVTPILYRETKTHHYLHQTLRVWADIYRDGISGKERIVVQYAATMPVNSTKEDDFVGRMLWALTDHTAVPAKRFADLDPAPLLDWLEPLSERRFVHGDLNRFGIVPNLHEDGKLAFSLLLRPTPYTHAPWMVLVNDGFVAGSWDRVHFQLARWLLRHLNRPELILWVSKHGGKLHPHFARMISQSLKTNPISSPMHTLWRLTLAGLVRGSP